MSLKFYGPAAREFENAIFSINATVNVTKLSTLLLFEIKEHYKT